MYVRGIRALFAFEGYVVHKITISGELVQVNLRRDRRCRGIDYGAGFGGSVVDDERAKAAQKHTTTVVRLILQR
jgi:hypothetical protein